MKVLLTFFLSAFAISLCQDISYKVLRVNFEINPTNKSQLLANLIDGEKFDANVTANQLIINTYLQELTLSKWNQILEISKLNFTRIDIEKIKEVSKTLKLPTNKIYYKFLNLLNNPREDMTQVLNILDVDNVSLMYTLFGDENGDEKFFDNFKNSKLTTENINHIKQITGLTSEDLFRFHKDVVLQYMKNVTLLDFTHMLKNITGEVRSFHSGYENGQVGILKAAFEILDVNDNDVFGKMLQEFNSSIVNHLMLTTRVSTGHYLTSKAVYDVVIQNREQFTKPFLIDENRKYEVANMTLNGTLVSFRTNDTINFVAPQNEVNQLVQCMYSINEHQEVIVSVRKQNGRLVISRTLKTPFVKGAPLFCDKQLVGVAVSDTINSIEFNTVPYKMAHQSIEIVPGLKPLEPPIGGNNTNAILVPSSKFLILVNFHVITSQIPDLAAYLLLTSNSNPGNLTTADFIEAYKLRNVSFSQFKAMLKKVERPIASIKLISLLESMNVSLIETYKGLQKFLAREQEENMLKALNISQTELHYTLAYGNGDEKKFAEFIAHGNFNRTNIEKAMKATGLNETMIYEFVKPIILDKLTNHPLNNILEFFHDNGDYKAIHEIIQMLNIKPENFKSSGFKALLTNFEKVLQNASALGSAVSRNHIITVNDVYDLYDEKTREFIYLQVEDLNGGVYNVSKITPYYAGYSNITLGSFLDKYHTSTIQIATDTKTQGCFMVTDDGVFQVKQVKNVHRGFEIFMDESTTTNNYKLGAALVCNRMLYGVATHQFPGRIEFASFRNPQVIDSPSGTGPGHSGATAIHINYDITIIITILASFTVFMY